MGNANTGAVAHRGNDYRDEVGEAVNFAQRRGKLKDDLSSRLELHVRCVFKRKFTSMVRVYAKKSSERRWSILADTEVVADSKIPRFVRTIMVDYSLEVQMSLRFEVYSIVDAASKKDLGKQEYIGAAEFLVYEFVNSRSSKGCWIPKPLGQGNVAQGPGQGDKKPDAASEIQVFGEETSQVKQVISFKISAKNLRLKRCVAGTPRAFVVVNRSLKDLMADGNSKRTLAGGLLAAKEDKRLPVCRTEVYEKRSSDPVWDPISVSVQALCRGENTREVSIEVFHWSRLQDTLLGEAKTTYGDLAFAFRNGRRLALPILPPGESFAPRGAELGGPTLFIEDVVVSPKFSFLDYIAGGLEVGLIVGIDFSRSNMDPEDPSSLHGKDMDSNDYVSAIRTVGDILQHYDADQRYPVYGFGARIPPSFTVTSDCFALTGDFFDPEVEGVEGIVDVYRSALEAVKLHGPTKFAPIVRLAANLAKQFEHDDFSDSQTKMKYFVLLIVTDGVVNDMQDTINEVVRASKFPISIVIIGVGDEDFSLMDELDADVTPLVSSETGEQMTRDIVQFVPFNEHKDSPSSLAEATLDEIPREVVQYFLEKGVKPVPLPENARELVLRDDNLATALHKDDLPPFMEAERSRLLTACNSQGYLRKDVEKLLQRGLPAVQVDSVVDILIHSDHHTDLNIFEQEREKQQLRTGSKLRATGTASPRSVSGGEGWSESAKSTAVCRVCFEREVQCRMEPCGHEVACEKCAYQLRPNLCPLCRMPFANLSRL